MNKTRISDLQKQCKLNDSAMEEFLTCHPKQIIGDLPVPVWKIAYKYMTQRNNEKTGVKYIIRDSTCWDGVENEFMQHIKDNNEKFPERAISNVEILDVNFIGNAVLELE